MTAYIRSKLGYERTLAAPGGIELCAMLEAEGFQRQPDGTWARTFTRIVYYPAFYLGQECERGERVQDVEVATAS